MGKYSTIHLPNGFKEKHEFLIGLSEGRLNELWATYGSKTLADYGLQWYWSQMNDWSCIDNSDNDSNFRIGFNYRTANIDRLRIYAERLAVILAAEVCLTPVNQLPVVAEVQAPQQVDAHSFAASLILGVVKPTTPQEHQDVSVHYNDPSCPQFAQDFIKVHEIIRKKQIAVFGLVYNEGSNLWSAYIDDIKVDYRTKDHSLSVVFELVFEYLEKL